MLTWIGFHCGQGDQFQDGQYQQLYVMLTQIAELAIGSHCKQGDWFSGWSILHILYVMFTYIGSCFKQGDGFQDGL